MVGGWRLALVVVVDVTTSVVEYGCRCPPKRRAQIACTMVPEGGMQHSTTAQTSRGSFEELASAGFEACRSPLEHYPPRQELQRGRH